MQNNVMTPSCPKRRSAGRQQEPVYGAGTAVTAPLSPHHERGEVAAVGLDRSGRHRGARTQEVPLLPVHPVTVPPRPAGDTGCPWVEGLIVQPRSARTTRRLRRPNRRLAAPHGPATSREYEAPLGPRGAPASGAPDPTRPPG